VSSIQYPVSSIQYPASGFRQCVNECRVYTKARSLQFACFVADIWDQTALLRGDKDSECSRCAQVQFRRSKFMRPIRLSAISGEVLTITRIGDIHREFFGCLLEDGDPKLSARHDKLDPTHTSQARGKTAGYPPGLIQAQGGHKLNLAGGFRRPLAQGHRQFLGAV
jgi:hypothetical protein